MFFELRQYTATSGNRDALVTIMQEEVIPFQTKCGMVILGSFVAEENADGFVWIRRFDSEADRERLYADVYKSDTWLKDIGPRIAPLIIREEIKVTRLVATSRSPIQ